MSRPGLTGLAGYVGNMSATGNVSKRLQFLIKMRVGADIFWPRHKIFVSGIANNGNYKKSTSKLNYVGKLEKHTLGSPKMIHRRPILQRLCPLSPWVEQWCVQPMAPRLPMVPRKAPTVGFGCTMTGLPVWGARKRRIEK